MSRFNKANSFNLSHTHKLTCHMGKLIPVMCQEVLPGDTFRWQGDVTLRLAPMLAPIMQDIDVYLHCFNVPSRLLLAPGVWENFITGGRNGTDTTSWAYVTSPSGGFAVGSLADYLGLPTGVAGLEVSALPFRAYQKIYNEWYRDENLISEVAIGDQPGSDTTTSLDLQTRAWHKDYFTGSLPWAQRGDATYLPLGLSAPVSVFGNGKSLGLSDGTHTALGLGSVSGSLYNSPIIAGSAMAIGTAITSSDIAAVDQTLGLNPDPTKSNVKGTADLTAATALSVSDMRAAVQMQVAKTLNARGGARLVEWILTHWGIRPSDRSLQRSEYIGGGKVPISITEVLQTSSTDATSPQGNMAGRGIAYSNVPSFTKTFDEHGYVICLLSIIPKATYQQGIARMWTRKDRWDYALPVFAHLGNQEVKNQEVYAQAPTVVDDDGNPVNENTFGYQERYEEYRRQPSIVSGQFKSSLNFWHQGRIFNSLPQLNKTFVECTPSKRIFAVTDASVDECMVLVNHHLKVIRRLPSKGYPGLMDHY